MCFGRRIQGILPNQFVRECDFKTAIEQRVKKQFEILTKKGRYKRDEFKEGDPVMIKNMQCSGKWDIKGTICRSEESADGSTRLYTVLADNGATYLRNSSHILHWPVA